MMSLTSVSSLGGAAVVHGPSTRRAIPRTVSCPCRAQQSEPMMERRAALGLLAGTAALLAGTGASQAAYGDAARVFAGKITNKSGFVPYAGEGFALLLPAKWNPSPERDFPGTVLRYEDNYFPVNNLMVIQRPVGKNSIEDLGAPDKFLSDNAFLFGESAAWKGESRSEGGFKPNQVSSAALLDAEEATDKKGHKYYKYAVLTRSADGDEGGRHHLVTATVSNGNLYILKIQAGDKRWFKGLSKDAQGVANSFTVA
ncbi:PSBP1 [Auxenochlorella protothecoides x Auxenochlorella symbiontica]|uniref:Oxygen-evolving enhancer protein 2, chloroplastic n=1 Tax=Auxenochlorella protothecoides TaxID=3075 RepID=A0A087SC76_AUXPR|nr:Oxygen-evolving enhancer protein 2, chloroplastic [Auxenochlorella protothecoides]KFM23330.1 Oxygen-evolving enhancer protein 2, chloroplastic [Auxenochlorella protothecoides]